MVKLNRNGSRNLYYISDLLYFAFIDSSYDPNLKATWVQNFGKEGATVDNVEFKDDFVNKNKNEGSPQLGFDPLNKKYFY